MHEEGSGLRLLSHGSSEVGNRNIWCTKPGEETIDPTRAKGESVFAISRLSRLPCTTVTLLCVPDLICTTIAAQRLSPSLRFFQLLEHVLEDLRHLWSKRDFLAAHAAGELSQGSQTRDDFLQRCLGRLLHDPRHG